MSETLTQLEIPRSSREPTWQTRRRWSASYTLSLVLHLSILITVPMSCMERRPPAEERLVMVTRVGPTLEELELASLAPLHERPEEAEREPEEADTAEPTEQQEPPPPELVVPAPQEAEKEAEEQEKDRRFARLDSEGQIAANPRFISAFNNAPERETRARPDTLRLGPPLPPSPTSEGATPKEGRGEATWAPIATRLPELAPGGAPAPEGEEASEELAGVEQGEEAAEQTPVEAEPEETPEEAAVAAAGQSALERAGAPLTGDPTPAAGEEAGEVGALSEPSPEEQPAVSERDGQPSEEDAEALADAEMTEQERAGSGGLKIPAATPIPDGPLAAHRATGGGGTQVSASRGSISAGAPSPSVAITASEGRDQPRAPTPGDQLAGTPGAPEALQLRAADGQEQAASEQRRPREGEVLVASTVISGPSLLKTQHSPAESAGAPGALSLQGLPTTSPATVGSEELPLDRTTSVSAVATDMGRYYQQVESLLRERWVVPRELIYLGAQGTTRVMITVSPSGQLLSTEVRRMSGYEALDAAAVAAFPKRLPPPPASAQDPLFMAFDFVQRDDWIQRVNGAD